MKSPGSTWFEKEIVESIWLSIRTSSQSQPQAVAKREVNNRLSFGSSQGLTLKDCIDSLCWNLFFLLLKSPSRDQPTCQQTASSCLVVVGTNWWSAACGLKLIDKETNKKYCLYFPFTDCRIYFLSTFLIATEISQQPRTYTIACDCKYPTCTWRVSCLIKISSINPKGQGDFRIYKRTFSYHDIIELPRFNGCCKTNVTKVNT